MAAIQLNNLVIDLTDEVDEYALHNDDVTLEPLTNGAYDLDMNIGGAACTLRANEHVLTMMLGAIASELGFKVVPIMGADNADNLDIAKHCTEYFDAAGVYHKAVPVKPDVRDKCNVIVKRNAYKAITYSDKKRSTADFPVTGNLIAFAGKPISDKLAPSIYNTRTETIGLSLRLETLLISYGLCTLFDIIRCTASQLIMRDQFGRASLKELSNVLYARGLRLGMSHNEIVDYRNQHKGIDQ